MIVKKMHDIGVKSEHAYLAAFASIGLTVAAWAASLKVEPGVNTTAPTDGVLRR